jgi:hypothetical protein
MLRIPHKKINWDGMRQNRHPKAPALLREHGLLPMEYVNSTEAVDALIEAWLADSKSVRIRVLSYNPHPKILPFIAEHMDRISPNDLDWEEICCNTSDIAIQLMMQYPQCIDWISLCANRSPAILPLLKNAPPGECLYWDLLNAYGANEVIDWVFEQHKESFHYLSRNPADRVVDRLLAEPHRIDLQKARFNSNPKMQQYVLEHATPEKKEPRSRTWWSIDADEFHTYEEVVAMLKATRCLAVFKYKRLSMHVGVFVDTDTITSCL